jgi:hypothetical protein
MHQLLDRLSTSDAPGDSHGSELWTTLTDLAQLAVRSIPGADGVGLTLVIEDDLRGHGVATAPFVQALEAHQTASGEGPSLRAAQTATPQQSRCLDEDARWPHFGRGAARMGVHSALSLPLLETGGVRGTVDVYAYAPDAFDAQSENVGTVFAHSAALALSGSRALERSRRLVFQLNELMCDRQDVDRAVGILMARAGCTPDEALGELRDCAAEYGRSVQEASRELVERASETPHAPKHACR